MKLSINYTDLERSKIKENRRKSELLQIAKQLQNILDKSDFYTSNNVFTFMIKNKTVLSITD